MAPLQHAIRHLRAAAGDAARDVRDATTLDANRRPYTDFEIRQLNNRLMWAERAFVHESGAPTANNFKHQIFS